MRQQREGMSVPDGAKKLARILRDGPDVGVYTLLAADAYASFLRCLESKDLGEFDGRVALSGGDTGKLLGDHAMGFRIKPNFGVLYEPDTPDILRKFKCYDLRLADWCRSHIQRS